MVSILLIILKIIGITLLVIIGILFLLLLLILFVPVRYRFKGNYDDSFHCKGKITWLLHFISIRIEVEKEVVTSIKILGIPLSVFLRKKKEVVIQRDETLNDNQQKDTGVTTQQIKPERQSDTQLIEQTDADDSLNENPQGESLKNEKEKISSEKKAIIQKVLDIYDNIRKKIQDIIQKIKDIIDKIKDFIINFKQKKKQLKRYLRILQSDTTKAAFALCKNKIFRMLKHIFPRKLRAELTFGFDDPAMTGYTLAVYGMLPEFVGKSIILHPDFDKQIFNGQFKVKGVIRAWTLLYQVLCILFDKNCRKLYHIVKKEISNEHK